MKIGFTYDLRDDYRALGFSEEAVAEFDTPETISEIAAALNRLGFNVDRIGHVKALAARLVAGERWPLVFNIAEGVRGRSREAQVPALLEAFDAPYVFADPLTLAITLDKAVAKRIVRDAGIATAPFAVAANVDEAALIDLPFPVFVKPLAEGTGKGCEKASRVTDHAGLEAVVGSIIRRFHQPALIEAYLPGREFTVGIVGTGADAEVVGIMELALRAHVADEVYGLDMKESFEGRLDYFLGTGAEAVEAGQLALAAYRALGCRDGGRIDVRSDADGQPCFMEANPLAGLHPTHSDLPILATLSGWSYDRLIERILAAATERLGLAMPQRRRSRRAA